ncbi:RC-LH1 core complex protein PufX [Palleronia abyssalis]|uniref:Intrinsic membrane protein PufX n=1 Tax=Palleronia abyssalis TaxID=1501240 RepID=A0A2R8BSA0_9RHOB|nr:RC-LH1 core complex protein PufX [Palleronia abyssalis]SPJ23020.1 hypothetical protein PAA8504_00825 [Palleronia abyssalis]
MSNDDKYWYLEGQRPSLYKWGLGQMALGAGYAALVFIAVIAFILILRGISYLLPEDPYAALHQGQTLLTMIG